ncbi:MAG: prolyl oligopeptidase family serine peptidase, partial [Longimicrobiales bacterium]
IHDVAAGDTRPLGADIDAPLADEDWDYPAEVPGYGVAGWMDDDAAVILRDKYDLWVVPTDGSPSWSLTDGRGRAEHRVFRLEDVDGPIAPGQALLLESYHDLRKNYGFYRARAGEPGVTRLLEDDKRFVFVARADSADRVLFTREAYDEFPDLWVADGDFDDHSKVTDVNPGLIDRYAWGSAELVEWRNLDGIPMQGVVIKPGNYQEGRRYPVLVYYYRFFSQRLHEFNDPSVNHRPSFPIYASDDYVVFLPDVRFEVGTPGLAATKSVVPGVQKLIDLGLADPDAVALHGHSWSGYQTAFIVTQTDLFATAVAGAPVANMTSAYSGIRLGSGLARQFQYEKTQSRIGGSLWENLEEYIENSPVFYADRIDTPMLILHGDVDDAVPWEQSIELYLALRRLGKETVFLQYRDEPHHPQRYANKLDWSIRMKEWIDHYTKGTPAPAWMTEGVPYTGN